MENYLKPEDLNTDACVDLAAAVLGEQQDALTHAARKAAAQSMKDARAELREEEARVSAQLADDMPELVDLLTDALLKEAR